MPSKNRGEFNLIRNLKYDSTMKTVNFHSGIIDANSKIKCSKVVLV